MGYGVIFLVTLTEILSSMPNSVPLRCKVELFQGGENVYRTAYIPTNPEMALHVLWISILLNPGVNVVVECDYDSNFA